MNERYERIDLTKKTQEKREDMSYVAQLHIIHPVLSRSRPSLIRVYPKLDFRPGQEHGKFKKNSVRLDQDSWVSVHPWTVKEPMACNRPNQDVNNGPLAS